mgnify:FL=1|jgi:hypothetical protein
MKDLTLPWIGKVEWKSLGLGAGLMLLLCIIL